MYISTRQQNLVSATRSLRKICKYLSQEIAREIMLFLINNVHEKISQKVKTDEILKVCARYF